MSTGLLLVVGIPLAWHLALVGYTFYDAGRTGMDAGKWAAIAFLVPLFGFLAYLFERGERDYDPEEDPYARGEYNVHESRADDVELGESRADDLDESRTGGRSGGARTGKRPDGSPRSDGNDE